DPVVPGSEVEVMIVTAEIGDWSGVDPIDIDISAARLHIELQSAQCRTDRVRWQLSERHIVIEIGEADASVEEERPQRSAESGPAGMHCDGPNRRKRPNTRIGRTGTSGVG